MPDTQYFTNIDGKYVKDAEARQQLNDLEDYVESLDQPWQPLEDGYSNFWFELTNDTLSPWLNFSAKTENAVIDWGDGSGEQALTTLTPTHTYSKAGRYVVKCKGVTGIARQFPTPFNIAYNKALEYVELNNEVDTIATYGYQYSVGLKGISAESISSLPRYTFANCPNLEYLMLSSNLTQLPQALFSNDYSMKSITIPNTVQSIGSSTFSGCIGITSISIPTNVTDIGSTAFSACYSLATIHMLSTAPPTLGTNAFNGLLDDFIIYVPVGYGDTYKSATGWSTYADHILEEGQTPNRMMLAKFNSEKTDEPQDDMR